VLLSAAQSVKGGDRCTYWVGIWVAEQQEKTLEMIDIFGDASLICTFASLRIDQTDVPRTKVVLYQGVG
jgi:hypothetical protein